MAARLRFRTLSKIGGIAFGALFSVQAIRKFKRSEIIAFASDRGAGKYELVHAQIAFRHGARTPIFRLPKMEGKGKDIEETIWDKDELFGDLPHTQIKYNVRNMDGTPQPSYSQSTGNPRFLKGGSPTGQLTKVGQQQTYNLGKELHRRYIYDINLINPLYSHKEVYIRTTNVPRTIQSVKCVVAGIYGQDNIPGSVTIITKDESKEILMPNLHYCPLHAKWARNTMAKSFEGLDLEDYDKNKVIFKQELGITSEKFIFVAFRDNMAAMEAHNLHIHPILMEYWEVIDKHATQELALQQCGFPFGGQEILGVGIGKFLEEILERMKEKISGVSPGCHKMCLYSVHDTSLTCLLAALGVFDNKWPDYAADLAFELYKNENEDYFVKVLLQGKELTLPGCESALCPFEKFKDLIAPYFIEDWETECKYLPEDS